MSNYFDIHFEFSKDKVFDAIDNTLLNKNKGYICVVDGVVLSGTHKNKSYHDVINKSLFSICDSRWITNYIKWIYNIKYQQYSGSQIFIDAIHSKKYKMMFLGTQEKTLFSLKENIVKIDDRIKDMPFIELPFCDINGFDYINIAEKINSYKPDIIWVALGAPKQEFFMANLEPYINSGIMIAVGAVFNFFSGNIKRAPQWIINMNIEFLYRIKKEPKKQLQRSLRIALCLPAILLKEYKKRLNITCQK